MKKFETYADYLAYMREANKKSLAKLKQDPERLAAFIEKRKVRERANYKVQMDKLKALK